MFWNCNVNEAVQLYIETLYKKSAKDADEHDLNDVFKTAFDRELKDTKITLNQRSYKEFCEDGKNIIIAFTNMTNRNQTFPSGKYEFIAVEDEIVMPIKNNVEFICYIDVVLKERATGRYRIIDIKTSTRGWNHYQRDDEAKILKYFYIRFSSVENIMLILT